MLDGHRGGHVMNGESTLAKRLRKSFGIKD
jgi:hypothetical protein